jgi:hypothetical protein
MPRIVFLISLLLMAAGCVGDQHKQEAEPVRSAIPGQSSREQTADLTDDIESRAGSDSLFAGLYMYMADAGLFYDCGSDRHWPVVQEADNLALETAYLRTRKEGGQRLLVRLVGRIERRPREDGPGERDFLVPVRFDTLFATESCPAPGIR